MGPCPTLAGRLVRTQNHFRYKGHTPIGQGLLSRPRNHEARLDMECGFRVGESTLAGTVLTMSEPERTLGYDWPRPGFMPDPRLKPTSKSAQRPANTFSVPTPTAGRSWPA